MKNEFCYAKKYIYANACSNYSIWLIKERTLSN